LARENLLRAAADGTLERALQEIKERRRAMREWFLAFGFRVNPLTAFWRNQEDLKR
jgi:hypothetical protein